MENLSFVQRVYSEYMDDLNSSEGFYVTPGRDGSVLLGGIYRVTECSGDRYCKAERAARFAVEEHNKKLVEGEEGSPLLKFLRIVNLNVEPAAAAVYHITVAVVDSSGERSHYQAKVWEKINTGYKVHIFRPAPYYVKSSDKLANNLCCVGIDNLMPWMDENYIYYKCFYRAHKELLGVEVNYNEERGTSKGLLWFRNCAESEKTLKKYVGKRLPCTNMLYDFDLSACPRSSII